VNRILTTHVGSLVRPKELLDLLEKMDRGGSVADSEYNACVRKAVADAVRQQADVGIDIVSDGEMSKINWISYLFERLTGFELLSRFSDELLPPSRDRQYFAEFYAEYDAEIAKRYRSIMYTGAHGRFARRCPAPAAAGNKAQREAWVCTGPIGYNDALLKIDIGNLKAALRGVDVNGAFLPVVAPASVIWLENEYYKSDEELVYAIAEAQRREYRAIIDAGFYLQVDDAVLAHEYDTVLSRGGTVDQYRRWAQVRIEALNHALAGLPEDRIRYHVCWGSWHGPHMFDPPLSEIIDLVFQVNAGSYAIEQANVRHEHEWRLWETVKLPDGKKLIPGVITHATNTIEHPELVADRLVRMANVVGRDNVLAGTDCGFAQGAFIQRVHASIQWAKLQSLVQGAALASQRLWKK
jgi:5-methyltetrahydropteroyltriglutamate--homocysteine methyltransferase